MYAISWGWFSWCVRAKEHCFRTFAARDARTNSEMRLTGDGGVLLSRYIFVTLKPFKDNEMIERITLGRSIVCPENKKFFFKVFWAAYTVWFLMFPIAVAGLINNSEDFVRTNAAWVVWTVRQCLGYMILLVLWWYVR